MARRSASGRCPRPDVTLRELLEMVAGALERAGIPYMIVGSLASTFHGEPRATQDVDIVIDPQPDQLAVLLRSFDAERFYVGDGQQALTSRSMFNVIEIAGGWKIDFIVRKDRPFSTTELSRRIDAEVLGIHLSMATAEDTIVAKLEWAATSGSDRQLADAAAVIAVSGDILDWSHLRRWAESLGLAEQLNLAISQAQEALVRPSHPPTNDLS
jgi:hypothetical protein